MPLTELQAKAAAPGVHPVKGATDKRYRLYDADGLYLEVLPTGGKYWRAKYRHGGKEKQLSLGVYPKVTLKAAREGLRDAKAKLKVGADPNLVRRTERIKATLEGDQSFAAVAAEWFDAKRPGWSEVHSTRVRRWLDAEILPTLGRLNVAAITAAMVTAIGQRIAKRGAVESAHRVLQVVGQVLQFAEGYGLVDRDASKASRAVLPPAMHNKFPAVIDPERLGEMLRAIEGFKGSAIVHAALRCLPYLAVRPGNLRMMEWAELDLDAALWTIPAAKLKRGVSEKQNGAPFKVPLPMQVVAILRELQPLTGARKYVFPSVRGEARPISDGSTCRSIRRI
jgi:integrase